MKISIYLALLLSFFSITTSWGAAEQASVEAQATYKDIKETLGIVPTFLKNFPEAGINGAWSDMKGIQLSSTSSIPGKYKELIGLAVAAQIPCRFCTYFHTEAAKLNTANAKELSEAVALGASTRRWSSILNGGQVEMGNFKKEVNKMLKFVNTKQTLQAMEEKPKMEEVALNTSEEAYADIKNTFGFVPTFIKHYPDSGIAGIWKEMKGVEMNPYSAIPGKYKDLIGLAVAAQIPCAYCVYYSTQSAMIQGASVAEINEAIAMAGVTSEWSTVLNGQFTDEKQFRGETNQIMKFLKNKMSKEVGLNN